MSRPQSFDHGEARRLYATGEWTYATLAEHYGVSRQAINYALNEKARNYQRAYQLEHPREQPCVNGCGRMARSRVGERWSRGGVEGIRSGMCRQCANEAKRTAPHGTETRYSSGCRCTECRAAATAAKRRRREATKVQCSHGCGRMVDGINRRNATLAVGALCARVHALEAVAEAAQSVCEFDERERCGDETLTGYEWGEAMRTLRAALAGLAREDTHT